MLVYFDPWIAGVVLPTFIILGLMALPFIDSEKKGVGYFSFRGREKVISVFLFGWLVLWVYLISVGTFLRGPNWNFFGLFETWDIKKVEALSNVNLSEYILVTINLIITNRLSLLITYMPKLAPEKRSII